MLSDPPPGWTELQARARAAKDAEELSSIIDEMNRLLSAHEKSAGYENHGSSFGGGDDPPIDDPPIDDSPIDGPPIDGPPIRERPRFPKR